MDRGTLSSRQRGKDPAVMAGWGGYRVGWAGLMRHLKLEKAMLAATHGGFFALDFVLVSPEKDGSLTIVSSVMGIAEPDFQAA
jgi:hypothetical protein